GGGVGGGRKKKKGGGGGPVPGGAARVAGGGPGRAPPLDGFFYLPFNGFFLPLAGFLKKNYSPREEGVCTFFFLP
ncbi:hypothetical protein AAY51_23865, partial [Vibrio parahaemolyticus]